MVVNKVLNQQLGNYGFNAANDTYGDMIEMGILDPTKGDPHLRCRTPPPSASLMLTTETMVPTSKDDTCRHARHGRHGWYGRHGHSRRRLPLGARAVLASSRQTGRATAVRPEKLNAA